MHYLLDYATIPLEAIQAWQELGCQHLELTAWMTYAAWMPHQWVMLRRIWGHQARGEINEYTQAAEDYRSQYGAHE
jgi:hypothetical protein